MTKLLVGFDSAWTRTHRGALVGALHREDGTFSELGLPEPADFDEAAHCIADWQATYRPSVTNVLLDQPTIVTKSTGQRDVEHLVSSAVSRRYGGMQPANLGRVEMFGPEAPLWPFLERFGGAADPFQPVGGTRVFETYPVLALIALGWLQADAKRSWGRLPKYNPQRRATFLLPDWQYLCSTVAGALRERGLAGIAEWIEATTQSAPPSKADQDCLDACLCLLVALHLSEGKDCLMVGQMDSGYIVVPYGPGLHRELDARCLQTNRAPAEWVRAFQMPT